MRDRGTRRSSTLKLLKARKLGTAFVDNEDLPKELHKVRPDNDPNSYGDHERRWHWVLDEMIWAMEQIVDDSADGPTNRKWAKGKLDEYQKHQERVQRGTKLFGKYFQHLWD